MCVGKVQLLQDQQGVGCYCNEMAFLGMSTILIVIFLFLVLYGIPYVLYYLLLFIMGGPVVGYMVVRRFAWCGVLNLYYLVL